MADQGAEGLLSPFLRAKRLEAARPHLKGKVLDVGCGTGAMAAYVRSEDYLGVDIDESALAAARKKFPGHRFEKASELDAGIFDSIAALAVIEHVKDPIGFLRSLAVRLSGVKEARIVCTTPHPSAAAIHYFGASAGLFSRSANEEHEELLDRSRLLEVGHCADLKLVSYKRFLLGANQLAIYAPGIVK